MLSENNYLIPLSLVIGTIGIDILIRNIGTRIEEAIQRKADAMPPLIINQPTEAYIIDFSKKYWE